MRGESRGLACVRRLSPTGSALPAPTTSRTTRTRTRTRTRGLRPEVLAQSDGPRQSGSPHGYQRSALQPRSRAHAPEPARVRYLGSPVGHEAVKRSRQRSRGPWMVRRETCRATPWKREASHVERQTILRPTSHRVLRLTSHLSRFTSYGNVDVNGSRGHAPVDLDWSLTGRTCRTGPMDLAPEERRARRIVRTSRARKNSIAILIATVFILAPIPAVHTIRRHFGRMFFSFFFFRGRRPRLFAFSALRKSMSFRFFGFAKKHVFPLFRLCEKAMNPAQGHVVPAAQD